MAMQQRPAMQQRAVMQRKGDPYIYLNVYGEWYCYNPQDSLLGSGAMGDVYKGYRCRDSLPIAVKRVKDCYANIPMIRERARQEASLAFRHDNLVEMIGMCEYAPDHGPIFMLSHFVHGTNSDDYVATFKDSPNRVEKVCRIICSVLDALEYVHSKGVVHRDIKPSNIMIENDNNVRLMDLGISRIKGGNNFSSFGFIGTPEYSAPEQIKREEGKDNIVIDATTDIYQLGITFYELLTGKNPMEATEQSETENRQLNKALPSSDDIPSRLMDVIWIATQKKQASRYQSAAEFKQAIQAALMREPTTSEKINAWIDNNTELVICGAAGVVAAIVAIIFCI
ncbi:MAG: serine/threonine protein kinase [Bacteroidales bacterium]|nr:serine/threonine protein kinase [Bacteroidales bacterium]